MLRCSQILLPTRTSLRKWAFFCANHESKPIKIHEDVQKALQNNQPVLALESTIITHGMPYPQNLKTAVDVENIARKHGVIPATIGVIDGTIHVGMKNEQLKQLSTNKEAVKLSKRDIPVACTNMWSGGTTVSATMLIAHWCGIEIFATGGVGGVHRMGENTMDISTDLRQLGQTPVTVVSAGVKSILDIPKTLEYLETEGVTVATFGKTKDFPAFFTQTSGSQSPANVTTIDNAVKLIQMHKTLNMQSGILIAVPIPNAHADVGKEINRAILQAVEKCRELGIEGNAVTPYILDQVNQMTKGASLTANIALIKNNVDIAARIAFGMKNLKQKQHYTSAKHSGYPVIIGGCNVDIVSKCLDDIHGEGPSNPATITQSFGGVGRNITETLWRLQSKPVMITAVGNDLLGDMVSKHFKDMGLTEPVRIDTHNTGVYNAVFKKDGEVEVGVDDSGVHKTINQDFLGQHVNEMLSAGIICVDANISACGIEFICSVCKRHNKPLLFEPTGELIAAEGYLATKMYPNSLTYMTPNVVELQAMYCAETGKVGLMHKGISGLVKMCETLLDSVSCILVTMGINGVLCAEINNGKKSYKTYTLSNPPNFKWLKDPVVNVSGSGDGFAGGFVYGILQGFSIDKSVRAGLTVAQRNLRSKSAVSEQVHPQDVQLSEDSWAVEVLHAV